MLPVWKLSQPVGATDSVSTRQIFTVGAGYGFDTVLDTGRTAAIQLPAGYSALTILKPSAAITAQ